MNTTMVLLVYFGSMSAAIATANRWYSEVAGLHRGLGCNYAAKHHHAETLYCYPSDSAEVLIIFASLRALCGLCVKQHRISFTIEPAEQ